MTRQILPALGGRIIDAARRLVHWPALGTFASNRSYSNGIPSGRHWYIGGSSSSPYLPGLAASIAGIWGSGSGMPAPTSASRKPFDRAKATLPRRGVANRPETATPRPGRRGRGTGLSVYGEMTRQRSLGYKPLRFRREVSRWRRGDYRVVKDGLRCPGSGRGGIALQAEPIR